MHRGYVKLWRKLQDSQHFSMGLSHIGLFSSLLILANHKTGFFLGSEINPGQFATSIANLSDRFRVSHKVCRKLLSDLDGFGMITHESKQGKRFTLITICNWETYQHIDSDEGKRRANEGQTEGTPRAQPGKTSGNNQGTQSKKGKNEKKVNNTNKPPTIEQVKAYCEERKNTVDPEQWMNHYQSNGWMVGRNKMRDWKAAVRTWEKGDDKQTRGGYSGGKGQGQRVRRGNHPTPGKYAGMG